MVLYNLSNVTSAVTYYDIFLAANDLSGAALAVFVFVVYYLVMFIAMKRYDTKSVFFASALIGLVIVGGLYFLNFVGFTVLMTQTILFIGSLMALLFWPEST